MSAPANLCNDLTNKINAEKETIQGLNEEINNLKKGYKVKISYEALKAYQEKIMKAFDDEELIKDILVESKESLKKEGGKVSNSAKRVLNQIKDCSKDLISTYEEIVSADSLLTTNTENAIDFKSLVENLAEEDEDFKKSGVYKNFDSVLKGSEEISLKSKDALSAFLVPLSTTFSVYDFTQDTGRLSKEIANMWTYTNLANQKPYRDSIKENWKAADDFKTKLDALLAQQNLSTQIIDMCNAIKKSNGCPE